MTSESKTAPDGRAAPLAALPLVVRAPRMKLGAGLEAVHLSRARVTGSVRSVAIRRSREVCPSRT